MQKLYQPFKDELLQQQCNYHRTRLFLGAVLIFLPGYDDIVTLRDRITNDSDITRSSDIRLFTLHSAAQSSSEQKQVFQPAPAGTRKIVSSNFVFRSTI